MLTVVQLKSSDNQLGMSNSFEHQESKEEPEQFIVVEVSDLDGGIVGYEVMPLAQAKKQNDDPNVQKLPDKMPGALHGSDPDREVFWREISNDEGPMSKEQAEDYSKTWGGLATMKWDEYTAKWNKKTSPPKMEEELSSKDMLKGELVKIEGESFFLEHKDGGLSSNSEILDFVRKEWPYGGAALKNMNDGLTRDELEIIRDNKGQIIGICSYLVHKENTKDMTGDGHLSMTLIKKEYRTGKSLGSFITKKAVERIIDSAKQRTGFKPPVVVTGEALTEGGWALMQKISADYGTDVRFDIGSDALLFLMYQVRGLNY